MKFHGGAETGDLLRYNIVVKFLYSLRSFIFLYMLLIYLIYFIIFISDKVVKTVVFINFNKHEGILLKNYVNY